ncbi:hypothetical protein R1flu_000431 [Riccia fluitans]|uniref:Uncharacterized protein n=1 Tax=Riccia fluitans TaxID=41844 RepID=A0ABD1Y0G0_9MARC
MRYLGRLLNGEQSDWSSMLRFFIRKQLQKRTYCRKLRYWSVEEALLLLPSLATPMSETTNHFLQSWFRCLKFLTLDEKVLILPGSLMLKQLQELLKRYKAGSPFNKKVVYPLLKRIGITMLANLADSNGNWLDVANAIRGRGIQLSAGQSNELQILQKWLQDVQLCAKSLETSPSWRWRGEDGKWSRWLQTSKFWHKLLETEEEVDDLTGKWPEGQNSLTWKARWKHLWSKGGLTRTNLWLGDSSDMRFSQANEPPRCKWLTILAQGAENQRKQSPTFFMSVKIPGRAGNGFRN